MSFPQYSLFIETRDFLQQHIPSFQLLLPQLQLFKLSCGF